jgi:hypothetical protein
MIILFRIIVRRWRGGNFFRPAAEKKGRVRLLIHWLKPVAIDLVPGRMARGIDRTFRKALE